MLLGAVHAAIWVSSYGLYAGLVLPPELIASMAAEEINDLFISGADGMFVILKEAGLRPEREWEVREQGAEYVVDLAIQNNSRGQ